MDITPKTAAIRAFSQQNSFILREGDAYTGSKIGGELVLITPWSRDASFVFPVVLRFGNAEGLTKPIHLTCVDLFFSHAKIDHREFAWEHRQSAGVCECPFLSEPVSKGTDRSGYVYFVAAHELGLVKIGTAIDVPSRVRAIQTTSPAILSLLGVLPCDGHATERRLHKQFHAYRRHGEWFVLSDEIRGCIARNAVRPASNPTLSRAMHS